MYSTSVNNFLASSTCTIEVYELYSVKMEHNQSQEAIEWFQAQSLIYKHAFHYANSMSLNCAVQLGIPNIIHNHKQPITLPELASALKLPNAKISCLQRLMRLLVHSGFFATQKIVDSHELEGYALTPASKLLLKDHVPNLCAFVRCLVDPIMVTPWQSLGQWLLGNDGTAFETAHGVSFWDVMDLNPEFNNVFNEAMANDSQMLSLVVKHLKEVFEGVESVVDVGGGTGNVARIILGAFPHLKYTVLDLPHVVANLSGSGNLNFVGGDMFKSIPSADATLLKHVMHNWSDEECLQILRRCREAISGKGNQGKVIIIDIVINIDKDNHDITETKLVFDILMMVLLTGRQRNEKEWENLFLSAGFSRYKITSVFGLKSLIEVFP